MCFMGKQSGSILMQTLLNLFIYSFFLIVVIQGIRVLSKPFNLDDFKVAYVQMQLDYLSALYQGAYQDDNVCFTHDICLQYRNHRVILTPGHQIMLENIEDFTIIKQEQKIFMTFKFQGIKRELYVSKK